MSGATGGIISVCLLIKDLLVSLNDSRGSSAQYQAVVQELYILDTALLQVEQLARSNTTTPELLALYETANQIVDKCRDSVTKFRDRIKKYSKSLDVGGSGNLLKDTTRKIQWQASQKDADIAKFRAEITGYSESINMLLATGTIKLLSVKSDNLDNQLAEDRQRTQAALDTNTQQLQEIQIKLDNNRGLISMGNSLVSQMMDRFEWIQTLGSDLKNFMSRIITDNIAIYREIQVLHSAFLRHVDRPLLEDPFLLEDAIGRIAPVHMRFINTWAAFQAVMETRFQEGQGLRMIRQKEYVLQEDATGKEIDPSLDFADAFLPGQKIIMSFVFKRDSGVQSRQPPAHCPRCKAISEQPTGTNILCSTCNMWFCRIMELHQDKAATKSSKRKVEEISGEDDDYSGFKRIRVVSEVTEQSQEPCFYSCCGCRTTTLYCYSSCPLCNHTRCRRCTPRDEWLLLWN